MIVNGVLRCMQNRANKICDPTSKQQEFQHLQAVFQVNGFLAELVRKTLSHQTCPTMPEPVHEGPAEPQTIMCLPYIRGLSESMHPTWGKSCLQTHEDTEADHDEGQELYPGRKKREVVYEVP